MLTAQQALEMSFVNKCEYVDEILAVVERRIKDACGKGRRWASYPTSDLDLFTKSQALHELRGAGYSVDVDIITDEWTIRW